MSTALVIRGVDTKQFSQPDLPGYVGFANLPNQVHRKSVKKGFEFTLMVVGESGLGKSTLINSLFLSDLYPNRVTLSASEKISKTVRIEASTVDIEERGVKLKLTVVDTPGFADALSCSSCFRTIEQYVDAQFEKYLKDESGMNRRNIVDSRVHCCFYFISPSSHGLKPIDIKFMKSMDRKVNIVPVIAKADMLTQAELKKLKKKIADEISAAHIQMYSLPECDDDEDIEYKQQCALLKEAMPFAVIGSNTVIEVRGRKIRGRLYPWGVVEVENPEHCDFIKLRTLLVTHMQDMQEVTQEVHYENFRLQKLGDEGEAVAKSAAYVPSKGKQIDEDDKLQEREKELAEKEAQLKNMQQMLAKMQAEMQQKTAAAAAASLASTPSKPASNSAPDPPPLRSPPPPCKPAPPPVAARKPSLEGRDTQGGTSTNNNHRGTNMMY